MKYKIFCDESNHLYSDASNLMVLGGILCPSEQVEYVNRQIKSLKHKHNYNIELKWTELSNKQFDFYDELLEFFFSSIHLKFNAQVVLNKSNLNHDAHNDGEADIFYYKMHYYTLVYLMKPQNDYNIFLDFKDTKGGKRARKLKEVIQNKFCGGVGVDFTIIHSHESQIIQLADILIGAVGYKNRNDIEKKSIVKNHIIAKIESLSGFKLDVSIPEWEDKFHIYRLTPRKFSV